MNTMHMLVSKGNTEECDRLDKKTLRVTKIVVVSLISFLLVEALLPDSDRHFAFLYLVLLETVLWVTNVVIEEGLGGLHHTGRLLATYIALSALIME